MLRRRSQFRPLATSFAAAGIGESRCFSEIETNFPSAATEKEDRGPKSRHDAGVNNSFSFSAKRKLDAGPWKNLLNAMASSHQLLTFPRNEEGAAGKPRPPLLNSIKCTGDCSEDDFAELGPQLSQDKLNKPGLVFVKGEHRQATAMPKNDFSGRESDKEMPLRQCNRRPAFQFNSDVRDNFTKLNEAEYTKVVPGVTPNQRSSLFVCIQKIPVGVSFQKLREEVSLFGEISSFSIKAGQHGLSSCHVSFKNVECKERALAAGSITVGNWRFPIQELHTPEYVCFRINNISIETTEPRIHSTCMSFGRVTGLARTRDDAADVVFRVKNKLAAQGILKRLNEVCADDCQWHADILSKDNHNEHRPSVYALQSWCHMGSQINEAISSIRKQLQLQRIYLEDLQDLHDAILHLKEQPVDYHS